MSLLDSLPRPARRARVSAAGADVCRRRRAPDAPTGLRAFLLRADEPAGTSFPRTPAFAWNPFPAQRATSSSSRPAAPSARTASSGSARARLPVARDPGRGAERRLPWITGSPHGALCAVARGAARQDEDGHGAAPFGFDVVPPDAPDAAREPPRPAPLDAGPRRERLPGLADRRRQQDRDGLHERPRRARVLHVPPGVPVDRHGALARPRAARRLEEGRARERRSRDRSTAPGARSTASTNPAPASGPIHLGATVSDVVTNGSSDRPRAPRLMPAFTWTGNEAAGGTSAEFFRVYVYTDRHCVNRVFTGSVVGSPAYAPRPYGGLNLPVSSTALAQARGSYLTTSPHADAEPLGLTTTASGSRAARASGAATPTTTLPARRRRRPAPAPRASAVHRGADRHRPRRPRRALGRRLAAAAATTGPSFPSQAQFLGATAARRWRLASPRRSTTVPSRRPAASRRATRSDRRGVDTEIVTVASVDGQLAHLRAAR